MNKRVVISDCEDTEQQNIDRNDNEAKIFILKHFVDLFLHKNSLIINHLKRMRKKMSKLRPDYNIANTVGVSVSSAGAVAAATAFGLALAPVTAGVSAVVLISGSVATGAGLLTSIGTYLVDQLITRKSRQKIKKWANDREECAEFLAIQFKDVNTSISNNIRKKSKVGSDFDFLTFIEKLVTEEESDETSSLMINELKALIRDESHSEFLDIVQEFQEFHKTRSNVSLLGKLSTMGNVTEKFFNLIAVEEAAVSLVSTTGPAIGKLVADGVFSVIGVVFAVFDVLNLVRDWKKAHPMLEIIDKLIIEMECDSKIVQFIYDIFAIKGLGN